MTDASGFDYEADPPAAFDDDALAEAASRAMQMKELLDHPGWEHFRDALVSKTVPLQKKLVVGDYDDFHDYLKDANYVRGLLDALKTPEQTLAIIEEKRKMAARLKEPTPDERT